ncbi:MAG: TlpA disulfide reductase family protein [Candidatus Methanosuratincola sp.]|jgi:cytochrome c biogenesis protein CcmG/thiol:disulfide interchange protein DsbE
MNNKPLQLSNNIPLLFLIIAVTLFGCNRSTATQGNFYSKSFSLSTLDSQDRKVRISDFRGSPIVVNFWASWCAPCREEMPFLEKSWRTYKEKGVRFIGINVFDERERASRYLGEVGVSFVNLYDPDGEVANFFDLAGLPVTLFVDREGNIVKKNFGAFTGKNGEKVLDSLVKEITY